MPSEAHGAAQPLRHRDAARRRGLGGALHLLVAVLRGPARVRGTHVLVPRRRALADAAAALGRDVLRVRHGHPVAVQHPALPHPRDAGDRLPHPARLRLPGAGAAGRRVAGAGARGRVPPAGRLLLRELGRPLRQVAGEGPGAGGRDPADPVRAAAGEGGHRRHRRRARHRLRAGPRTELPAAARSGAQAVDAPLRVPQPRLRRLSRLLRVLQARLPRHPRPVDRADGRRDRGRRVPPGRRAEEAGPAGRRAGRRRRLRRHHPSRAGRRAAAEHAPRAGSGCPRGTRPPIPGSTSPRAPASTTPTGSGTSTARSRSASSATTRPGCGGGRTSRAR